MFVFSIFLTTLIYLIINYDYIILKSGKISHIGILEVKFFFNFFFPVFFWFYNLWRRKFNNSNLISISYKKKEFILKI